MPPKTKITREMILDAAFALTRENGVENVNARTIAERLGCSTQPIMYCFSTIDEIRREVFRLGNEFQTKYIAINNANDSIIEIGVRYIRFAAEEKQLFRLLFQSDNLAKKKLDDLICDRSVELIIKTLMSTHKLTREDARDAFTARFMTVHGMASLLANNSMIYDEAAVLRILNTLIPMSSINGETSK